MRLTARVRITARMQIAACVLSALMLYGPALAEPIQLEHDGKKGLWFDMATARNLLKDVSRLPEVEKTLSLTEGLLKLQRERGKLLELQLKDSEQIAQVWRGAAQDQAKLVTDSNSWWRSPYLWMAIGLAAGVGSTIGIAVAIKRSGAVD